MLCSSLDGLRCRVRLPTRRLTYVRAPGFVPSGSYVGVFFTVSRVRVLPYVQHGQGSLDIAADGAVLYVLGAIRPPARHLVHVCGVRVVSVTQKRGFVARVTLPRPSMYVFFGAVDGNRSVVLVLLLADGDVPVLLRPSIALGADVRPLFVGVPGVVAPLLCCCHRSLLSQTILLTLKRFVSRLRPVQKTNCNHKKNELRSLYTEARGTRLRRNS